MLSRFFCRAASQSARPALVLSLRTHSQAAHKHPYTIFQDGELDPRFASSDKTNMRRLNPDTMAHYVKATIQNDRRECGLGEVVDWTEFAKEAIYIPTRSGPLWVGSDDPRAAKFMRRKEKMKVKPLQKARKKPGADAAKELENHPLREYFTTATNLQDPLSVANNLHRAGLIKEYDIKHTAAKISYKRRPPVVSIMGHVDHGKTTLLDYLRHTNVAAAEAGGITQNVGAFRVEMKESGHSVTFIDTPGHAAFVAMREVGVAANDVVILVVSAVDGVQPQTREVIELVRKQGTPMVVAVTKIDRNAEWSYVKEELRGQGVELEEDGGDVQLVPICAKDGRGIEELLEAVHLQAELGEVATPTPSRAELIVLESRHDGVNEVAAVVRCGHARPGQVLVAGTVYATVKKVLDAGNGTTLVEAGPSTPVLLHGFHVHPKPGSILLQVSSEAHAQKHHLFMRDVYKAEGGRETYLQQLHQEQQGHFFSRKPDNNLVRAHSTKPFVLCCKAATFGMLQALMRMIYELPRLEGLSMEIKVTDVGGLRDYEVAMLGSSGQPGCILLFGDCKDANSIDVPNHISVHRFNVLYHGMEELKQVLVDELPKLKKVRVLGAADCLQVFKASQAGRGGNAGGMKVTRGSLTAAHLSYRVLRKKPSSAHTKVSRHVTKAEAEPSEPVGSEKEVLLAGEEEPRLVVYYGQMKELRRFKDLVPSVDSGLECGVILHDEFNFKMGDVLEAFEVYEESRDVAEEFETAEKRERAMREAAETQARLEEEREELAKQAAAAEQLKEKLEAVGSK